MRRVIRRLPSDDGNVACLQPRDHGVIKAGHSFIDGPCSQLRAACPAPPAKQQSIARPGFHACFLFPRLETLNIDTRAGLEEHRPATKPKRWPSQFSWFLLYGLMNEREMTTSRIEKVTGRTNMVCSGNEMVRPGLNLILSVADNIICASNHISSGIGEPSSALNVVTFASNVVTFRLDSRKSLISRRPLRLKRGHVCFKRGHVHVKRGLVRAKRGQGRLKRDHFG